MALSVQDDVAKMMAADKKAYRSSPLMTRYEFNQIISLRTEHIAQEAPIFVDDVGVTQGNMPLRAIAERELLAGKLPYIVRRPMPNGKIEYWKVSDLDLTPVRNLFRHVNMRIQPIPLPPSQGASDSHNSNN